MFSEFRICLFKFILNCLVVNFFIVNYFLSEFLEMSTFSHSGEVGYKAIFAASVRNRSAFDGTVPKTVGSSGYCNVLNTGSDAQFYQTVFVLAGLPSVPSIQLDAPETKISLAKACVANVHDLWFDFDGNGCIVELWLAACPPSSFPSSADYMYLYHGHFNLAGFNQDLRHVHVDIPDIERVSVPNGWNVCVNLTFFVLENGYGTMNYHGVVTLDD